MNKRIPPFVVGVLALVGPLSTAVGGSAAAAQPPDGTYEVSVSPETVRPGGTVLVTGTCWVDRWFGATQQVNLYANTYQPAPGDPYVDFQVLNVPVSPDDGSFRKVVTVPATAPPGTYALSSQCITEDQVPGNGDTTFGVAGPPIATTSTSTSSTTSTTVPPPSAGRSPSGPPAPEPRTGRPVFTG